MHVVGPSCGPAIELHSSTHSRLLACISAGLAAIQRTLSVPVRSWSTMLQTGAARQAALAAPACAPHGRRAVIMRAVQFRPCIDIHKVRMGTRNEWLWLLPPLLAAVAAACRNLPVHKRAEPALQPCGSPTALQGKVKQIVGSTLQDLQRCVPPLCTCDENPSRHALMNELLVSRAVIPLLHPSPCCLRKHPARSHHRSAACRGRCRGPSACRRPAFLPRVQRRRGGAEDQL